MNKKKLFKSLFMLVGFIFGSQYIFAQSDSIYNKLSTNQIDSLFTDSIKKEFKIQFPIYKVYSFNDKEGNHLLVLTESDFQGQKHEFNDSIHALNFILNKGKLELKWAFLDYKIGEPKHYIEEESIWFWTKYISLIDIDNDGLIDPIIIYGTSSSDNGFDDGRIKILTYYKGNKSAIREQNGVLDYDRFCKVDAKFYKLPMSIQIHVISIMQKMDENAVSNFPAGWEEAMKAKKLLIDEGY